MGETGLKEIAFQNFQKTHFLKQELSKIPGYKILNQKPTYNEFLVKCPNIDSLILECKSQDLLPPLKISKYYPDMQDVVLVCVTEMNSMDSLKKFILAAQKALENIMEE